MKKIREFNSKTYYIYGALSLLLGLIILIISITLPLIYKEISFLGWIGFGGIIIACPILFYSFYLLKKGNFVKLNKNRQEILKEEQIIEPINDDKTE